MEDTLFTENFALVTFLLQYLQISLSTGQKLKQNSDVLLEYEHEQARALCLHRNKSELSKFHARWTGKITTTNIPKICESLDQFQSIRLV